MKCKRCNANISGNTRTCPLCQNPMEQDGNVSQNVFPYIQIRSKREKLFTRILTLVLFSSSVLCVMLNLVISTEIFWSLFVVAGAACLLVSLQLALKARRHVPKAIFWEILLVAILAVLWDLSTGWYGWSINYVVPILFSGAIIIIRMVATVLKMAVNDYIVYLITNGILGIIPLIFILTNIVTVVVPSMLCVTISLISLGALFIFDRRQMLDEIKRRAHI